MKILVCIKQVPESNKVEVDPVTGVLKRDGAASKMNPYDLYALETAFRIREQVGGTVHVEHFYQTVNLAVQMYWLRVIRLHRGFRQAVNSI